jgi:hypothetical protein
MDAGRFVALAGVAPVEDSQGAPGKFDDVRAAEERITEDRQIVLVAADDPLRRVVEPVDVDAPAVEVEGQEPAAELPGPAGFVRHDHAAGVRVATAVGIGLAVTRLGPVTGVVEMLVVGMLTERFGHERMRLHRVGAGIVGPGKDPPQMAVDGVDEKPLAAVIPVVAPGIGRAVADRLENALLRMVAPHAATERHALARRAARGTDLPRRARAAAAVEPAVRSPGEPVGERVVAGWRDGESVEDGVRRGGPLPGLRAVRLFGPARRGAVRVADEQQPWRAEEPQATPTDRNARQSREAIDEHRVPLRHPVAVGILEECHPIVPPGVGPQGAFGVGEVFGDEQPTGGVDRGRHRIADQRLARQQRHPRRETHGDRGPGLLRRERSTGPFAVFRERFPAVRRPASSQPQPDGQGNGGHGQLRQGCADRPA